MSASLLESSSLKTWETEKVESRKYQWEILKMLLRFSLHLISSLSFRYMSRCIIIKSKFTVARFNLCILLLYLSRILNFKRYVIRVIYHGMLYRKDHLLELILYRIVSTVYTLYMTNVFIFHMIKMFSYDSSVFRTNMEISRFIVYCYIVIFYILLYFRVDLPVHLYTAI